MILINLDNGHLYITQSVIKLKFSRGPRQQRYNGVAMFQISLFCFAVIVSYTLLFFL